MFLLEFLHKVDKHLSFTNADPIIQRNSPAPYTPVPFQLNHSLLFRFSQKVIQHLVTLHYKRYVGPRPVCLSDGVVVEPVAAVNAVINQLGLYI